MWDWDLITHIFRIYMAMVIAAGMVATIVFSMYLLARFVLGLVMEIYETITDRRMRRRGRTDDDHDRQG